MDRTLKKNLNDRGTWTRLIFLLLYSLFCTIAEAIVLVILIVQFLSLLITGETNRELRDVGYRLGDYVREIIHFLTFHGDEKPWPFGSAWPELPEAKPAPPKAKPEPPEAKSGAPGGPVRKRRAGKAKTKAK